MIFGWFRLSVLRLSMAVVAVFLGVGHADADILRSQTIQLQSGWNSIFLEVTPTNTSPNQVFTNLPIDIVASHYASHSSAQFMSDPSANMLRETGWGVWYAPARPDAFLKTLNAIHGNRAYLVHATTNFSWSVNGCVEPFTVQWVPKAYNFVGFCVDPVSAPTFQQFFSSSLAHNHNQIYRLVNGAWRQVTQPDAASMRAGEGFWIFASAASQYQGPLRAELGTFLGVFLKEQPSSIVLRNEASHPLVVTLEHMPVGLNGIPLSIVIQVLGDPSDAVRSIPVSLSEGVWTQSLPPMSAASSIRIPLQARLLDMRQAVQMSLLKVTTDLGTVLWIPVYAIRDDLESR